MRQRTHGIRMNKTRQIRVGFRATLFREHIRKTTVLLW